MQRIKAKIDLKKNAQRNADDYYTRSKRLLQKAEGAKKAVKDLEAKLLKLESQAGAVEHTGGRVKIQKKEWFEAFHWFYTSGGLLVVGGRDATQNELLNSRHFDEGDLFFHADVFGASVTIMKGGKDSKIQERYEAAQFAASYSSAWKGGISSVDVYAMRREQVGKSSGGGYLSKGSFSLSGEREWYRAIPLALVAFAKDEKFCVIPKIKFDVMDKEQRTNYASISMGRDKKSEAAKALGKITGCQDIDYIMQQLPAGGFRITKA